MSTCGDIGEADGGDNESEKDHWQNLAEEHLERGNQHDESLGLLSLDLP